MQAAPRSNGTNATSDDYLEYTDPKPSSEREPGAKKTTPQPLKSWAAVASTKYAFGSSPPVVWCLPLARCGTRLSAVLPLTGQS